MIKMMIKRYFTSLEWYDLHIAFTLIFSLVSRLVTLILGFWGWQVCANLPPHSGNLLSLTVSEGGHASSTPQCIALIVSFSGASVSEKSNDPPGTVAVNRS